MSLDTFSLFLLFLQLTSQCNRRSLPLSLWSHNTVLVIVAVRHRKPNKESPLLWERKQVLEDRLVLTRSLLFIVVVVRW